jgi:hypothetical protein
MGHCPPLLPVPTAIALGLAVACAPRAVPCLGVDGCPVNTECLAARCVNFSAAPVASASRRISATPSRMAIATDDRSWNLGPSAVLGSDSSDTTLYLHFAPIWQTGRLDSAFLILEPARGALPGDDVPLQVFRVQGPWTAPAESRGRALRLVSPTARGIGRAFPDLPVRIDVTAIVRYLARNPDGNYGLAVRATRGAPPGLAISTGLDGGSPPRLDVYFER